MTADTVLEKEEIEIRKAAKRQYVRELYQKKYNRFIQTKFYPINEYD